MNETVRSESDRTVNGGNSNQKDLHCFRLVGYTDTHCCIVKVIEDLLECDDFAC